MGVSTQSDCLGWRPCQGVPDQHPSGTCDCQGHGAVPGPGRGPAPLLLPPRSCQPCAACPGLRGGCLSIPPIPHGTGTVTVTSGTGHVVPDVVRWPLHTGQSPGVPHKGSLWFEGDVPPHPLSSPDPRCLAGSCSVACGRPSCPSQRNSVVLRGWTDGNTQQPVASCPAGSLSLPAPLPIPCQGTHVASRCPRCPWHVPARAQPPSPGYQGRHPPLDCPALPCEQRSPNRLS